MRVRPKNRARRYPTRGVRARESRERVRVQAWGMFKSVEGAKSERSTKKWVREKQRLTGTRKQGAEQETGETETISEHGLEHLFFDLRLVWLVLPLFERRVRCLSPV